MSKWDESHTEPIHDTPAEKDVLIRAMEAAGFTPYRVYMELNA